MKPPLERNPTRKRHSWWWDSHISPKNSKWLAENLEGKLKLCMKMFLNPHTLSMQVEVQYHMLIACFTDNNNNQDFYSQVS
jgi:hypothetical protein